MATFPASRRLALAALSLLHFAGAQNPGTTPDVHPPLTTYKCTTGGGCVAQDTSVVIDWGYHWIHTINGTESCTTSSGVNTTLCPNEATCAQNCVIEGANYTSSGVSTSGDSLTMYQYVQSNGATNNASPRLYLLGPDGNYEMLQLLGKEFRFDVDLSTLPCGENGALYLTQMDATGGRNPYNTGGANYGSGYCDAQCPVETWRNGTLNTNGAGYCCNEMDILEANSEANAFTPHPCYANGTNCDKSGCGFNPYAQGYHNYYGPNATDTVDTSKPFTIITQFLTSGGTSGTLTAIKRIYQQNGVTLPSAEAGGDEITESWCESSDSAAASFGGLTTMGEALGQGMVLAFSIWNDASAYMNWLDSGNNGPCSSTAGNPATIEANDPGTHVVFSNIRWGDINSTFTPGSGSSSGSGGSSGSSSISTSSSARSSSVTGGLSSTTSVASKVQSTSSTRPKKTATRKTHTQSHWGQCGGMKHKGPTACASPYSCKTQNPWYAQCL